MCLQRMLSKEVDDPQDLEWTTDLTRKIGLTNLSIKVLDSVNIRGSTYSKHVINQKYVYAEQSI